VVNLTSVNATDLPLAGVPSSALALLAEAIDREFARREPERPDLHEYAAAQLGVDVADLAVVATGVGAPTGVAVGAWLYAAQQRYDATHTGIHPRRPAVSEQIEGAQGAVPAFRSVTVHLPAGVVHSGPVLVRLHVDRFDVAIEAIARREDQPGLGESFDRFVRTCASADSPYLRGTYRVDVGSAGLTLTRWVPPKTSRDLLKLDPSVWDTVDRSVHRVLDLAEDLQARGLASSSGVLLVGPPGTGKTQLGTVVAGELAGRATVLVPGTDAVEHYLTDVFDLAASLSPCLVLMDDLDLVAGERGTMNPHRLREFLNVMDGGLADRSGVVVIASTNDHRKVDKAAQRSSRFDTVIHLDAPSREGRVAILERYLAWADAELDLAAVARATEGATGADLKELVRAAVIETGDQVTTAALLAQAARGRWQSGTAPAGVYL
jgi:hypothetical protein